MKCWCTMLMPRSIASLGFVDRHRLAVHEDLALVGVGQAVEDVHQGRLPGAVLAEQRVDLAGPHVEVDVVVGEHAGIALRDPAHLDARTWAASVVTPSSPDRTRGEPVAGPPLASFSSNGGQSCSNGGPQTPSPAHASSVSGGHLGDGVVDARSAAPASAGRDGCGTASTPTFGGSLAASSRIVPPSFDPSATRWIASLDRVDELLLRAGHDAGRGPAAPAPGRCRRRCRRCRHRTRPRARPGPTGRPPGR